MRRVVVTGYGAVTPFGYGVDTLWASLLEGKNGIQIISNLDLRGEIVNIGACLPAYIDGKLQTEEYDILPARQEERCFFCAVKEAVNQSGIKSVIKKSSDRVILSIADRKPSLITYIDQLAHIFKKTVLSGNHKETYLRLLRENYPIKEAVDFESINHYVSRAYHITGPQLSIATACASGNNAIGETYLKIKNGLVDIGITGGAYSLDFNSMLGFSRLGALTTNPNPDTACRPFDRDRDGFVMGSGCGILILEEYEHAVERGAFILGEIVGYSTCSDAYRATDSDPSAQCATYTIQECIRQAGIHRKQVGYINAHGTSTKMNDYMETKAIKNVFKEYSYDIPISSTKSMMGHSIMAAGAIEAIVCLKSLQDGMLHQTRNYKNKDEELDLDYISEGKRKKEIQYALSNSFGFGGQNSALLLCKYRYK